MTRIHWPMVSAQVRFEFSADHAMRRLSGCEVRHTHHYIVTFGYTHEIQPLEGFTHEFREQQGRLADLVKRVAGQYLNDLLPMQPSVEVLALWFLAQTDPTYCDVVTIEAYGDYAVRVERARQRSEWLKFLAGRGPDPFSNQVFVLK